MEEKLMELLAQEALKNIDIEAFAKDIMPEVTKEIKTALLSAIKEMDWMDFVYETFQTEDISRELGDIIKKDFMKSFKGE